MWGANLPERVKPDHLVYLQGLWARSNNEFPYFVGEVAGLTELSSYLVKTNISDHFGNFGSKQL